MGTVMSKKPSSDNNAVNPDDPVDFLIITALPVELEAVLRRLRQLRDYRRIQNADFPTYFRATLETATESEQENRGVAVTALAQMGNVSAAVRSTRCIQRLKPSYVFMVGIAGGIKEKVNLGDVVVSNQIIYYESTKETPSGSEPRVREGRVDDLLLDRAIYYDTEWGTLIRAERPDEVKSAETPEVHFGLIAAGEKVIADGDRANELRRRYPKLYAIEMESYGAAAAAAESDIRPGFIAIRGIADYADAQKNDAWREYAADSAAAFTVWLLRCSALPIRDISRPRTPKTLIAIHQHSMEAVPIRLTEAALPEVLRPANVVHVEIDQTELYDNGRLTEPVDAAKRQMDIMPQLYNAVNAHPDSVLCYCGIAHIPLLFHIGCQGLNRMRLHFFEHNRFTKQWEALQEAEEFPQIEVDGLPDVATQKAGDVIVRISISYPVSPEAIEGVVSNPIGSVNLSIDPPTRDVVISEKQLVKYSMAFRDMLDAIIKKMPNTDRIHMFYAGPVALAVDFGRQISKTLHPKIIVYNYSMSDDPPGYAWGLEVNSDVDSQNFLIDRRR